MHMSELGRELGRILRDSIHGSKSSSQSERASLPPSLEYLLFKDLHVDMRANVIRVTIEGEYYRIPVIYDIYFYSIPEVDVHMDVKEIFVKEGQIMFESFRNGKATRVVVKP